MQQGSMVGCRDDFCEHEHVFERLSFLRTRVFALRIIALKVGPGFALLREPSAIAGLGLPKAGQVIRKRHSARDLVRSFNF
ncbi:hypothetical protein [Bradyrhizobium sp. STM 3557]|uniref:hypothetical protein n=1 Tax=Bradyrhizobium sp. STM 3557 TaxID=578920 RepID=UPI00388DF5BD